MPPPDFEESTSSEESDVVSFNDIINFFPYLKNLEAQVLDPEDFVLFPDHQGQSDLYYSQV